MSRKSLNQLPAETVKLLASSQVITSVSTAVKELVENSLDADSRSIQVKLDNYGLDVIEVKDDGHGIAYDNVQKMFLSGYTSKISCFDDLAKLDSYGFRGEALSAIAKLSRVSVTTKTSADSLAMTYTINREGVPESSKPSHISKGTIITVMDLFANLPVRKQYLSSKKKVGEELKKVEQVIQSLSLIHPELRISLIHNKCPIWQKNSVKGLKQSFMQVVGLKITSRMEHLNELGNNILTDMIVPKKGLDNIDGLFTSSGQSVFMYVNMRPVTCSKLSKLVMDHIFLHFADMNPSGKYAVCLISVQVPTQEVDVNLEPNKTKVYLKNESEVASLLDQILSRYYEQKLPREDKEEPTEEVMEMEEDEEEKAPRKRPRVDEEAISRQKDEEFLEKNDEWLLEVISADGSEGTKTTVCSQINRENCTLATQKEVGELARMLEESGQRLITSINTEKSEEREKVAESKPILPSWPIRQVPETKPQARTEVVREEVNLSAWSKGTVEGDNGQLPGGVALARPGDQDESDFDSSLQSASRQMGKKEKNAFTKFAKIMRPKIVQEFPGIVFTRVAGLITDRWKALPADEKKQYEKLGNVVAGERKEEVKTAEKVSKKGVKRPERREITLTTSFADIVARRDRPARSDSTEVQVLGQLTPSGNWLYRKGNEIGHVRHSGLRELILSRRMMSGHSVPRQRAPSTIVLTEDVLGNDLWSVLLGLETEVDPVSRREVVVSDVVSKNGFRVELERSGGVVVAAWITEVASVIPFYGAAQLKEALALRLARGGTADLADLRTTPVVNYITNEAVRMAQEAERPPARDDLLDWISTWSSQLKDLPPQCPHCRDIFVPIYNLQET